MAGMKITLSSAMRARDVSRPRPEHDAAAQAADAGQPPARPAAATPRAPAAKPSPASQDPAPAGGTVAGSGVKQEQAQPATGGQRGSRRHRSRRRSGRAR
jgi:hypothetical protein